MAQVPGTRRLGREAGTVLVLDTLTPVLPLVHTPAWRVDPDVSKTTLRFLKTSVSIHSNTQSNIPEDSNH